MTLAETEDSHSFIHQEANYQPGRSWRTWLIGRPLSTADAPHQTIGKAIGLAVFASDALSSTAYATQEIIAHPGRRRDGRVRFVLSRFRWRLLCC